MRERKRFITSLLGLVPSLAISACSPEAPSPTEELALHTGVLTCAPPASVDPRRSLAVTDLNIGIVALIVNVAVLVGVSAVTRRREPAPRGQRSEESPMPGSAARIS